MNYDVKATTDPLGKNDLYEGRTVCFSDLETHPNNIGILLAERSAASDIIWKANINGTTYHFYATGVCYEDNTKQLYGVITEVNLDIATNNSITRGSGGETVTTTLSNITPKDQFATNALEALINRIPDPISMDDSTILSLAIKAYKISQAMLYIGTLARGADATPEEDPTDPVSVDANNLNSDVAKILYNLNENIKVIKTQHVDGLKIGSFGEPLCVDNPEDEEHNVDKFQVEGAGGGGGGGSAVSITPVTFPAGTTTVKIADFTIDTTPGELRAPSGGGTPPTNMVTTDTQQNIVAAKDFVDVGIRFGVTEETEGEEAVDYPVKIDYSGISFNEDSTIYSTYINIGTVEDPVNKECIRINGYEGIDLSVGQDPQSVILITEDHMVTINGKTTSTAGFVNAAHNDSDSILIGDGNVANFRDLLNELQSLLNVRIAKVLTSGVYNFDVIKPFVAAMGEGYYYVSGILNWSINDSGTIIPRSIEGVIFQITHDSVDPTSLIVNIIGGEVVNAEEVTVKCYRTYNENTGEVELKLTNPCLDTVGSTIDSNAIINAIISILGTSYSFTAVSGQFEIVNTAITIKGFIIQ